MKKIIYLLIAICFEGFVANGQYSCTSAKKLSNLSSQDPIPPSGTVGAAGPDYACLNVTGRQLWYYVPVCNTNKLNEVYVSFNHSAWTDTIGIILYGPFSQPTTNCSDFNSSKIVDCTEKLQSTGIANITLGDTLFGGNYYYLLVTFSDSVGPMSSYTFFTISNSSISTNCFECNNQVSVIDKNNICMVSVDTAINKCVLTWEEFPDVNLAGYNIYRESTLTGIYDSIATIPVGSMSSYTDIGSSPSQHNYTYGVRGVDSCGNTYAQNNLSNLQSYVYLTSIHLISFAGGNNEANLIWNNVYTNNDFIPQYYIYRNNNGSGWQVIDSIGITLSTITYTDIFAPAGTNQYTVELKKLVPCVPMRPASSTAYQSVFSNTSTTMVTGLNEYESSNNIVFYPNPFTDKLNIRIKENDFNEVTLFDVTSRKIFNQSFTNSTSISTEQLAKGIYIYEVRNKNGVIKKGKVVKD